MMLKCGSNPIFHTHHFWNAELLGFTGTEHYIENIGNQSQCNDGSGKQRLPQKRLRIRQGNKLGDIQLENIWIGSHIRASETFAP